MVRRRAEPSFAELAKRRPDFVSPHFGLVVVMRAADAAPAATRNARAPLGLAVPKRLLPRAVDRNACKRVAREAWRLAPWAAERRPAIALIKLRRAEPQWKTTPARALKKAWRAELDELLLRIAGQRPSPGRPPAAA